MADEISVEVRLVVQKNSICLKETPGVFNADWSTMRSSECLCLVGTTPWGIPMQNVTAMGWAWFMNLDTGSATIELGMETSQPAFYPLIKLGPGEFALLNLKDSVTISAKASAANTLLEFRVFNA